MDTPVMTLVQLETSYPQLLTISQSRTVARNEMIVVPGQACSQLYWVKQGALRQYYLLDGKEVIFRLAIESDFSTSAYALLTANMAFDYVEAVEDTHLLVIDYERLRTLYAKDIGLANLGRQMAERYFLQEQERLLSLTFKSPLERYQTFVTTKADYLTRFTLGTIASFLGMTPETLSRVRGHRF